MKALGLGGWGMGELVWRRSGGLRVEVDRGFAIEVTCLFLR